MVALDNLVVVTALPVMRKSLGTGIEGLQWTVSAYTLTYAVCQLSGAALGDRFGRRRVFTAGLGLFTLASTGAALSTSMPMLVAARAVQGLGSAIVTPLALTILAGEVPRARRAAVLGAWSGISGIAIALGPLIGGVIVEYASWQWIFIINVPIGLALIPAAAFRLSESRGPNDTLDLLGAILASASLFSLVYGVINGNRYGWTSTGEIVAFVAGAALLAAFIAWELRATAPMLPLTMFGLRGFSAATGLYLMMAFGLFGSIFLLTQFLQSELLYSPLEAGLSLLPAAGMPAISGPLSGPLAGRIGGRAVVMTGLGGQAVALAGLSLTVEPAVSYWTLLPLLMLLGLSIGLFLGQISRLVLGSVPSAHEGMASGTGTTFRQMGTVLGVSVLGAVFSTAGGFATPRHFVDGLVPALAVAAAVSAVATLCTLLIPHRRAGPAGVPSSRPPAAEALVDD
jgi:EmrB/QacA subfamily drug resistance transporter